MPILKERPQVPPRNVILKPELIYEEIDREEDQLQNRREDGQVQRSLGGLGHHELEGHLQREIRETVAGLQYYLTQSIS